MKLRYLIFTACFLGLLGPALSQPIKTVLGEWQIVAAQGEPVAREEAGFVAAGGKFFLVGGRHENPVDIFDPKTRTWTKGAVPPLEIHHFQPVAFDGKIYVLQSMTGAYPRESPFLMC